MTSFLLLLRLRRSHVGAYYRNAVLQAALKCEGRFLRMITSATTTLMTQPAPIATAAEAIATLPRF